MAGMPSRVVRSMQRSQMEDFGVAGVRHERPDRRRPSRHRTDTHRITARTNLLLVTGDEESGMQGAATVVSQSKYFAEMKSAGTVGLSANRRNCKSSTLTKAAAI